MGITKTIKHSTTKLHFQAFINVFMLHENHQVGIITMGQSRGWQRDISRLGDFKLRIWLTVQNKASFPDVKCSPHSGQPPGTALFWRENVPNVKCHHLFSSKFLAFSAGKNLPNMEICLLPLSLPWGHVFACWEASIYIVGLHGAKSIFTVVFQNQLETYFDNAVFLLNHRL